MMSPDIFSSFSLPLHGSTYLICTLSVSGIGEVKQRNHNCESKQHAELGVNYILCSVTFFELSFVIPYHHQLFRILRVNLESRENNFYSRH